MADDAAGMGSDRLEMAAESALELTVVIVSYNTCALTLACLDTLFAATRRTGLHVVVLDNGSTDGSADAIAAAYPQVELIRSQRNLGFAAANNHVAASAETEWLLLLNPDTEVHDGAVDQLLDFARAHPEAGITGGRTVFPDGSLNPASCWMRITPWSLFCLATGLTTVFRNTAFFNPEGIGGWQRDSVRQVDIVQGSFLMISRALWSQLGGFSPRYFMYGEEADLCLRAIAEGYRPMITPDAQIMHLAGASSPRRADKIAAVARGRMTLIRDHWPGTLVPLGVVLMWFWGAVRVSAAGLLSLAAPARYRPLFETWRAVWARRQDWLAGYS